MAQEQKDRAPLIGEATFEASELDPVATDSKWFLPMIGLALLCIYLVGLNLQSWGRLEAVCDVAMSKDALTLCLQYGAR